MYTLEELQAQEAGLNKRLVTLKTLKVSASSPNTPAINAEICVVEMNLCYVEQQMKNLTVRFK